jgi:hypothetical protein
VLSIVLNCACRFVLLQLLCSPGTYVDVVFVCNLLNAKVLPSCVYTVFVKSVFSTFLDEDFVQEYTALHPRR